VLADATVSRCHADLRRDGSQWILRDLHSTNGIAVNGRMVPEARLAPGDQISLGRTRLEWTPADAQTR
jgi:pSer/pThr/pTyr-binding forkhead associated (FHA) protein